MRNSLFEPSSFVLWGTKETVPFLPFPRMNNSSDSIFSVICIYFPRNVSNSSDSLRVTHRVTCYLKQHMASQTRDIHDLKLFKIMNEDLLSVIIK